MRDKNLLNCFNVFVFKTHLFKCEILIKIISIDKKLSCPIIFKRNFLNEESFSHLRLLDFNE